MFYLNGTNKVTQFQIGLFLYLVAVSQSDGHHQTFHTISSVCDNTHLCQEKTCCTLNQLIASQSFSGGSNLTLHFLPGKHVLNQTLAITGYKSVHLTSKDATIITGRHSIIELTKVDYVNIESLSFTHQIENFPEQNFKQVSIRLEQIKNVRLEYCKFKHFKSVLRVITIHQCGIVTLNEVIFESNLGQSLFIDSSYIVKIINSKMFNNQNQVLSISSHTFELTNSEFNNNVGHIGGGGALELNSNASTILNCQFLNNSANYGGALFIHNIAQATISHSVFSSNSAACGGAVAIDSSDVTFDNCMFQGNTALIDTRSDHKRSLSDVENLNRSYLDFKHNDSICGGGGIFIWSGNVSVSNTSLIYNTVLSLESVLSFRQRLFFDTRGINAGGGAILMYSGSLLVINCILVNNICPDFKGGGILIDNVNSILAVTVVDISGTKFIQNSARIGGAIFLGLGQLSILKSQLILNKASLLGGAIYDLGSVLIVQSKVTNNTGSGGGAIHSEGFLNIQNSILAYNEAEYGGGALTITKQGVISNTTIMHNSAKGNHGGAIILSGDELHITYSSLTNNIANQSGGALMINYGNVFISHSDLEHNSAVKGAVLYAQKEGSTVFMDSCCIAFNNERGINGGIIYSFQSFLTFLGTMVIENNNGSTYALFTQLTISGHIMFANNRALLGGAINAVQSEVYFTGDGDVSIFYNTATSGGGMYLKGSSVSVDCPLNMSYNKAQYGGGIYAFLCTIKFKNGIFISTNHARYGGGISAIACTIELLQTYVHIKSNRAEVDGGGINLRQNSKIYILKLGDKYNYGSPSLLYVKLIISNNSARRGGGIFVADATEIGGQCRAMPGARDHTLSECFIQTLYLYDTKTIPLSLFKNLNTEIMNNNAKTSGENIYGGLLDRCTVNPLSPFHRLTGWEYFQKTVNFSSSKSITSDPVQVVFCSNTSLQVSVRKGEEFKIPVMAVDQIGKPVNAIILNSVITKSGVGRLKEGQAKQSVLSQCTNLTYNVFSADNKAHLLIFAQGPCTNLGISKTTLNISFSQCMCPIGFQPSKSSVECQCMCDATLRKFLLTNDDCFYEEGTVQLREDNWIGVENTTNRTFFIHSRCPFDYCKQRPVNVSFASPSSINKQCNFNRSGVLCGKCEYGLSLVLATSNCKQCSNIYLLLLIPFALAGVILVGFIFIFHMTVANGAITSLIFYANILAANRAVFMPFNNFLTIFISWVNLDLGIETCLYNGMTSEAKILLQLVFPLYLFLWIFLIILLCKHFPFFSNLLSNRNPVAALGTLILLSYSKLLRFIITALQYRTLGYSHSTYLLVWLYDGNVKYFSANHIPEFVAAILILVAGILFTTMMLFGQWFPLCSKWSIMKWTKNTKYAGFMDVYHAPFTPKHRYWVGLLLLALISHNIIVAMAPNTSLPVLSSGCISVGLLTLKVITNNKIYKSRFNSNLETLFLLNLATLCFGTSYVNSLDLGQVTLSSISLSMAFILFVVILMHHLLRYTLKSTSITAAWSKVKNSLKNCWQRIESRNEVNENILLREDVYSPTDVEFEHYDRVDSPIEEVDYITPPIIRSASKPNKLRLSYMDDLAPVTDIDYEQSAPPSPQPAVTVTHTHISLVQDGLIVHD